ncbi:class I SAM-dependent methyltransferase [Pseudoalteromonas sp. MMG005]|uniref:class I SAM-dependent methyltransferase n=1 Tax=Pseudoalteromonas sp. MMG005 TaxID=2822682 RepID=UPI001B39D942|nr:class I SAM-dependent methyltransferase [Pseudoalteromonas sp. MMG005]MBQ4846320.1 class I SAM-dependent methyltransferase [Pseudoalteromonas sp. MMG005]
MAFCENWDELYRNNEHMSVWPWSEIVSGSLRHTNLRNASEKFAILEVGCGAGANFPFFLTHCPNVYGMDGSSFIIEQLKERYPSIAGNLHTCDFTKPWPISHQFDLIVDRGASVHNGHKDIQRYLNQAYEQLKEGGIMLITDWFSTEHSDYEKAPESIDKYTKSGYTWGPFAGVGSVNFFDAELIHTLVQQFEIISLDHSSSSSYGSDNIHAAWSIVLKKR